MRALLVRFHHHQVLVLLAILFLSNAALAFTPGTFRAGILAGQVGLMGDVGQEDRNSIGYGVSGGYSVTEEAVFDVSYTTSSHTNVNHRDFSLGVDYYFGNYETGYPHVDGGASFLSNSLSDVDRSGEAFGLYVGVGFDFEMSPVLTGGVQGRFQKAFESTSKVGDRSIVTVDDSVSVMLRFLYRFGEME